MVLWDLMMSSSSILQNTLLSLEGHVCAEGSGGDMEGAGSSISFKGGNTG